jgi:hypothetical protein
MSTRAIRTARRGKRARQEAMTWSWGGPMVLDGEREDEPAEGFDDAPPEPDHRIPIGPLDVAGTTRNSERHA